MSKLTKVLLSLTTISFILSFSACNNEGIIKSDKSTKNNAAEVKSKILSVNT
ncbi:hypothetical protein [Clostridium sp.]|jgi:hypothetical protein|uniref:hypothetical protein n=1 Tax=Clostridium sp. TaxID=1506 RepID=UPI00258EDCF9|nr:hypothetical protein [Clostridium sp.]MDF2504711.1 hypothetical protein [Clostridium sp.]